MSKFYITTSIAYVNAAPHIGFALELIQADVLARYHRHLKDDVFFLTGTDEHGQKIFRAAEKAGKSPQEFIDEVSLKFKALKETLNLSWDYFIRTSDEKEHYPNAIDLWKKLVEAGDIYEKEYEGLYCVGHEAFITEKELEDGVCPDHKTKPELIKEKNYFFRLSKYAKEIESRIMNNELSIIPEARKNEILSFIKQGVSDISFSRPKNVLPWGIPVPGDESQVMYVWADALSNYLYPKKYWPADVQVIGKDILRFHALFWPAILLSAKLPLPKKIFVHGFITSEGQKMSKTIGNVVNPVEIVKKYGVDALRYYLLREIPSTEDGDFSIQKFEERYNGDLANGLGNFVARVLTLATGVDLIEKPVDENIEEKTKQTIQIVKQKVDDFKFNEALFAIWELISFGDKYINESAPWKKEGEEKTKILLNLIYILYVVANCLAPFLPETAEKLLNSVNKNGNKYVVKKIDNLFPRIK